MSLLKEMWKNEDQDGLQVLGCFSLVVGVILAAIVLLLIFFPKFLLWTIFIILVIVVFIVAGYFIVEWAYAKYKKYEKKVENKEEAR